MAKANEKTLTEDDVRSEHLSTVNQPAHWAYLFAVLVGGTIVMIVLIAAMAGGS
ncbi:MAG TPA: hypothetical protein VK867_06935 [Candidatus Limnocylindrales bacterium]|nr:hypothetical protein [Candidatus Limnocylindrales bacterium]